MRYPETAALIKSARRRKGWSQEKAALIVGCSRLQFIRWEQGLHRPETHAPQLVESLGVDEKALETADPDDAEAAMLAPLAADPQSFLEALHTALGFALDKERVA